MTNGEAVPADGSLQGPKQHRPVRRTVFLTRAEDQALTRNTLRHHVPSRAEYLRMLIEKDSRGELLLIDDAIQNLAQALGAGFGAAVGQMSVEGGEGLA